MNQNTKRAIVLMNLGSPESTEVKDVKKYLDEFLMDKRVMDSPFLLRLLLVKGIITPFRAPQSAEAYKSVWTKEGSPLIVLTKQLKEAVQQNINEPVVIAMRYGNPTPKDAFDELAAKYPNLEEVTLLPLYPQYAMSSYETAVVHAEDFYKKGNYSFKIKVVPPFYNQPDYVEALTESMRPYLKEDFDHVLFSYHGLPQRHILKGDVTGNHCYKADNCCSVDSAAHKQCYRHQCYTTTNLVAGKLNLPKDKFTVSFQSRLGRSEWVKPYTAALLEELPKQGIKKLVVICPAFVSDCLETLEEIAMEGKHSFLEAGGESFTFIPCLNVDPLLVKAITKMVN